jgi:hypothetical protein
MKNLAKLALISSSLSLVLTACQPGGVSGKYLCLNPNNWGMGIAQELTLNFTSDHQVTVSFASKDDKDTGKPNTSWAVPSGNYKYVIEDKKVTILGLFGTPGDETFLIQGNELVHHRGKFFWGHQCKKQ